MRDLWKRLSAPFLIVKREKLYIGWVVYSVIFGMINFIAAFLMGDTENLKSYIQTGQLYTFSIALCSPLIIDTLLSIKVERKLTGATHFLGYKITGIAIVFISVIAMVFLWIGENCGNLFTQVIFTLLSLFMAYYLFLVGHMKEHDSITGEYDDQEYLKSENNRIEETQNKLEDASEYDTKGGKIAI